MTINLTDKPFFPGVSHEQIVPGCAYRGSKTGVVFIGVQHNGVCAASLCGNYIVDEDDEDAEEDENSTIETYIPITLNVEVIG